MANNNNSSNLTINNNSCYRNIIYNYIATTLTTTAATTSTTTDHLSLLGRYSEEIRRLIQQQAGGPELAAVDPVNGDGGGGVGGEDVAGLGANFTDLGLPDGADDAAGLVLGRGGIGTKWDGKGRDQTGWDGGGGPD